MGTPERSVLVYKRNHVDDPNPEGEFGWCNCMRSVRGFRKYEAIIGVGGPGRMAKSYGIACRLTWIGISPTISGYYEGNENHPILTFDHFVLFNENGRLLSELAPHLAEELYEDNKHYLISSFDGRMWREIDRLLALARNAPPSSAKRFRTAVVRCNQRRHPKQKSPKRPCGKC
jgi:hypothetical protein